MNKLKIMNISGVECYEENGVAYLNLEQVARGLGFVRIAASGNEVIRWERVKGYLESFGVPTSGHGGFIPENIFFRLAMKAKNEVAEKFQAKVADEILPSIRKYGMYATDNVINEIIDNPEFGIRLLTELKEERDRNRVLLEENKKLEHKAEYYNVFVNRKLNLSFRDTAKELMVGERWLIEYLMNKGYIYRDKRNELKPYAQYIKSNLFALREYYHNGIVGTQTLITPKGRLKILSMFKEDNVELNGRSA